MSLQYNFSGKVVLITGSSSGIGAATAVQFSRAGANVVVTGRRADRVSEVAKECLKVSPKQSKALEVVADVTKPEDLRRLVDTTIKHFGKLDVLVNNAGAGTVTSINNKDFYETYQKIMQINVNSVVYLTHICVEHLEKTKGNIINISSVGGMRAVRIIIRLKHQANIFYNTSNHNRSRVLHPILWRSVRWICSPNAWPRSWDPNVSALMSSSN